MEIEKHNSNSLNFLNKTINGIKLLENKTKKSNFCINDFNNFIGSSRKLIVNNKHEYWIHDELLIQKSLFFKKILVNDSSTISSPTTNLIKKYKVVHDNSKYNEREIIKTKLNLPFSDYFFDILIWLYGEDEERLNSTGDETDSFLSLISLGTVIEIQDSKFFEVLISSFLECTKSENLHTELFSHHLWSRFYIDFNILLKIIQYLIKNIGEKHKTNFYIILALLSWLKEDNHVSKNMNDTMMNKDLELFNSKEFFQIKKFIEENSLMENFSITDLEKTRKLFPNLIPVLDSEYILQKNVIKQVVKISCRVCKRTSNNIQDFNIHSCEVKLYHPKSLYTLQRQFPQINCEHENCNKKFNINEYPCCHKGIFVDGCTMSDGKHILIFSDKEKESK